jgi:hypothetical protein
MSQPLRQDFTFSGTLTDEAGDGFLTKAHDTIGLFVNGEGVTSLDITVQGSPDRTAWTALNADDGEDIYQVTDADLDSNGNYYMVSHNFAIEFVRPFVRDLDATNLDVYLFLSGKSGRGVEYARDLDLPNPNP